MFNSLFHLLFLCVFAFVAARPRVYRQNGTSSCPLKEQLNSPGMITSPGHPGHYPNNSTCTWIIASPKDTVVWLEFTTFDIKSGPLCGAPRCKCDFVQIRKAKKFVEKFCEGHLPKGVIRTSSKRVRVLFVSDMTDKGNGFSLKFWFVSPTTSPPPLQNITTIPSLVASKVPKQTTNESNATSVNVMPVATTQKAEPITEQTTSNPILIVNGPTKSDPPSPLQVYTPTTEVKYGITPVPSETYTPVSRPIKARSTPLKDEPGPAPGSNRGATPNKNNNSVPVAMFSENKDEAKKIEEEADPPDAIVLGPSIPIILIFIGVVTTIAWWKFRSDKKERLRYYKEQIRYEEISKRKRLFKKKQSMREIRTKRLYSDMTRSWQGSTAPPPITSRTKRSFAGRLLELAEKPVSYIKTPRSSRPSSMVLQEQSTPLVVLREKKDKPESGSRLDPGNRPPSRPASMLLRDALNMIFGTTSAQTTSPDSTSETPKDTGSGSNSKRASLKRVSFYDVLVEKMAEVKESEDEANVEKRQAASADKSKLAPLSIPHIMVRQPSYDSGDEIEIPRKSPTPKSSSIFEEKSAESVPHEAKAKPSSDPVEEKEQHSNQPTEPTKDKEPSTETDPQVNDVDAEPGTKRPRSFDQKLVEMLEELQQEGAERERDDKERDELEEPPPPAPHQTPDPRDSASTSPTGRTVNCTDLEDFLLNLDREIDEDEDQ